MLRKAYGKVIIWLTEFLSRRDVYNKKRFNNERSLFSKKKTFVSENQ